MDSCQAADTALVREIEDSRALEHLGQRRELAVAENCRELVLALAPGSCLD